MRKGDGRRYPLGAAMEEEGFDSTSQRVKKDSEFFLGVFEFIKMESVEWSSDDKTEVFINKVCGF